MNTLNEKIDASRVIDIVRNGSLITEKDLAELDLIEYKKYLKNTKYRSNLINCIRASLANGDNYNIGINCIKANGSPTEETAEKINTLYRYYKELKPLANKEEFSTEELYQIFNNYSVLKLSFKDMDIVFNAIKIILTSPKYKQDIRLQDNTTECAEVEMLFEDGVRTSNTILRSANNQDIFNHNIESIDTINFRVSPLINRQDKKDDKKNNISNLDKIIVRDFIEGDQDAAIQLAKRLQNSNDSGKEKFGNLMLVNNELNKYIANTLLIAVKLDSNINNNICKLLFKLTNNNIYDGSQTPDTKFRTLLLSKRYSDVVKKYLANPNDIECSWIGNDSLWDTSKSPDEFKYLLNIFNIMSDENKIKKYFDVDEAAKDHKQIKIDNFYQKNLANADNPFKPTGSKNEIKNTPIMNWPNTIYGQVEYWTNKYPINNPEEETPEEQKKQSERSERNETSTKADVRYKLNNNKDLNSADFDVIRKLLSSNNIDLDKRKAVIDAISKLIQ